MKKITKILAAVDFSDDSLEAFDRAAELACGLDAELVVLTVPEAEPRWPAGRELKSFFEDRMRPLSESGDTVRKSEIRVLLEKGDPVEKILEAAEKEDAGLVVMGTHGRRGLVRALMGSVAEGVIRGSVRPVLVVPQVRRSAPFFREEGCAPALAGKAGGGEL